MAAALIGYTDGNGLQQNCTYLAPLPASWGKTGLACSRARRPNASPPPRHVDAARRKLVGRFATHTWRIQRVRIRTPDEKRRQPMADSWCSSAATSQQLLAALPSADARLPKNGRALAARHSPPRTNPYLDNRALTSNSPNPNLHLSMRDARPRASSQTSRFRRAFASKVFCCSAPIYRHACRLETRALLMTSPLGNRSPPRL